MFYSTSPPSIQIQYRNHDKKNNLKFQYQKSRKATKSNQTSHKFIARLRWNSNESPCYCFGQKISMLKLGRHVDGLPTSSLRKWCRASMFLEFELAMGFCASCTAPSLSSNTGIQGMPTAGNMKRQTCLKNRTSLMTSASATYSASVVDSETHFCLLKNHETQAPARTSLIPQKLTSYQLPHSRSPRQQTPANSNLLRVLYHTSLNSNTESARPSHISQDTHCCPLVHILGSRTVLSYCSHCIGDVWPSLSCQPHQ